MLHLLQHARPYGTGALRAAVHTCWSLHILEEEAHEAAGNGAATAGLETNRGAFRRLLARVTPDMLAADASLWMELLPAAALMDVELDPAQLAAWEQLAERHLPALQARLAAAGEIVCAYSWLGRQPCHAARPPLTAALVQLAEALPRVQCVSIGDVLWGLARAGWHLGEAERAALSGALERLALKRRGMPADELGWAITDWASLGWMLSEDLRQAVHSAVERAADAADPSSLARLLVGYADVSAGGDAAPATRQALNRALLWSLPWMSGEDAAAALEAWRRLNPAADAPTEEQVSALHAVFAKLRAAIDEASGGPEA